MHGVSIAVVLRLRTERNPVKIGTLLELSRNSVGFIHFSLFFLLITGVALAFMGEWWGHLWVWLALAGLVSLWVGMSVFGTRYYDRVRKTVGVSPFYGLKKYEASPSSNPDPSLLNSLLSTNRSIVLVIFGIAGMAFMLWLMVFKPF